MSTPPKGNKPPKSIKKTAREESFHQGIALLEQAKFISDPDVKKMAEKAAINICIKGAITPIGPAKLLAFISFSTAVEVAICITAMLNLPLLVYSAVIFVTSCFWFILVAVALALGNVFSETVLAKLMTTVFGKLIEKTSQWMS